MNPAFAQAMDGFAPGLPLAVAYSGGADSTALLLACARRWPAQVLAVHVNHGLQAAADSFEHHARGLCERLGVPLLVRHVDARHGRGESPEDAARRARRRALVSALAEHGSGQPVRDVALAQHADDQVETLLLALSRGAGLPGLAAMPRRQTRDGLVWHRPLLDVPGADLRAWLRAEGVEWIEDPSNQDQTLTRNRIRHRVLPGLIEAFPKARETFARSARHAAQAQDLLAEVALQDLSRIGDPPRIEALRGLSRPRCANVLRHWLRLVHGQQASTAQMEELLDQIEACTTRGHRLRLKVGDGYVVREGDGLGWYN